MSLKQLMYATEKMFMLPAHAALLIYCGQGWTKTCAHPIQANNLAPLETYIL
jgi:hypothetical protein